MNPTCFFVQGLPKPQPRPRAFSRGGVARVYDPHTAEGWKSEISLAAKPYRPETPITGPIRLRLDFAMPRPKAHYGKKGLKPQCEAPYHIIKPDLDNLVKAVMDALSQLQFWLDDCQVCSLTTSKQYVDREHQTGVSVDIRWESE